MILAQDGIPQTDAIDAEAGLPPLIPRDVLFGNPDKAAPEISPDGRKLAYLAPSEGVLNVWVRTLGQSDDRVITTSKKRPIRQFFWQGDSEHIIYLQDLDGDENWHFYQAGLTSGIVRDLTPFQGVRAMPVAIDPLHSDRILVGLNLRDRRLVDVYRIDLNTGAVELDTENPGDVAGWFADHNMQVRAAQVATPDGGAEIRSRSDVGSEWRTAIRWGIEESLGGVLDFTPDNRGLWLLCSVDANTARLLELDLDTHATRTLSEDPQYDVSGLLTHPRTHALEAVEYARDRNEWVVLDPAVQADFDLLRGIRDGDFKVISRDLDDKIWTVAYVTDDGPVYYYAYDRAAGAATLLFSNRSELEQYKLAKMRPITYAARDGMTLHGYLTLPVGLEPRNLPLILLVHGGPWARDVWGFSPFVQWLANRGYAVLQINFRGSTGYGKAYLNAANHEWAGKMQTDLLDGKEWAIREGYADPQRVAIMGGSYGGYATLVGVAHTPDEFVCGVDLVGPSSIFTLFASIPPYWEPIKALFLKRVGDPVAEEEYLRSISPLYKAHQIKVPLLIAQGANDPRVKQAESDQIVEAMRANGKPVEYLVFPDEGHGFARPENNQKFAAAAEAFLGKYLGGRVEPPAPHESAEELRK
jgi:dipeptidyl aminopeptidase/acylaminoacyl peptidase